MLIAFAAVLTAALHVYALVQPRGTDSTFDLVTWNLHDFRNDFRTVDTLAILINDLNVDMFALQEIADTTAFYRLLGLLPGWAGYFAPYDYPQFPYLKTAVLWRTDRASITSLEQLFIGYEYQFPRPPIHVVASVTFGGRRFAFNLIVLHLKADHDYDSIQRRRAAIIMLKNYLDNAIPNSPDSDWVVAGDYNDELDDPQSDNVFWPLLMDSTDYRFLTMPLAGNPYWASYPSLGSLIDHIMITRFADDDYGNGNTITLRLDDEYSNYSYRISDHRPVMSQFEGVQTSIRDDATALEERHSFVWVWPNPFEKRTGIYFWFQSGAEVRLEIYDLLGRRITTLVDEHLSPGAYAVEIDGTDWASGVYFVRLQAGHHTSRAKLLLLK